MKPKCIHEPIMLTAVALERLCKHCGVYIEPLTCEKCDGTGVEYRGSRVVDCRECGGDGVLEWREIKDDDGSDD